MKGKDFSTGNFINLNGRKDIGNAFCLPVVGRDGIMDKRDAIQYNPVKVDELYPPLGWA